MHYIRFLKSPSLSNGRIGLYLNAKVTITTDLGESFLCFDLPILVILLDHAGNHAQVHSYQWKAGKRELEISFPLPLTAILSGQRPRWPFRLLVQPRDSNYHLGVLGDLLLSSSQEHSAGVILPVLSEQLFGELSPNNDRDQRVEVISPARENQRSTTLRINTPKRVARRIYMAGGDEFYIWEETGESIARHIWDAGLLLAAFLDSSSASTGDSELELPECLKTLLSKEKFEVLELGTGCGIVGITMAKRFSNAQILITDMSEAEEIARHNISMITGQTHTDGGFANIAYQNLDWKERLPENLRNGNLDLVLVADCTYNSDVVPDLVETLADLVKYNQDVVILVAMKIRHDSEMAFFELMRKTNIVSLDELVLPLPLLGQDAEEIELHFFKGG